MNMTEPNIGVIVQQLNTIAREGEKVSDIDTSRENERPPR